MYIDRVYDQFLMDLKDPVILDVGANVGLFSFYAYPYAQKIYALEPSESHSEVLNHMVTYNKMYDKIVHVKKALSHANGTAKFYHNDNVTMFSLREEVNIAKDYEEVETITLDKLLEDLKLKYVDFMKLDVEGSECEILGSEGFAKVADKIGIIVGEYHTWSGINPNQLMTTMQDLGFKFRWLQRTEASIFVAERIK